MSAQAQVMFEEDHTVRPLPLRIDAQGEDAHWRDCWRAQHYVRPGRQYEDYAPAYCVGYIGHAQYGGSYEDAENSLYANWVRIRGDSPLGWEEALAAIRAAWDRMEAAAQPATAHPQRSALQQTPIHARASAPTMGVAFAA
jgi:hypothetical protein